MVIIPYKQFLLQLPKLLTSRLELWELAITDLAHIHSLYTLPQTDEFNTLGIPASLAETKALLMGWVAQQSNAPRIAYMFGIRLINEPQLAFAFTQIKCSAQVFTPFAYLPNGSGSSARTQATYLSSLP